MCFLRGKNGDLIEIHGHEVLKYGAAMAQSESGFVHASDICSTTHT